MRPQTQFKMIVCATWSQHCLLGLVIANGAHKKLVQGPLFTCEQCVFCLGH